MPLAVVLWVALTVDPALAIDVGSSLGRAGGASVGLGSGNVSVGASAAGGTLGASVGASVGIGAGAGAAVSAGGGAGVSVGTSSGGGSLSGSAGAGLSVGAAGTGATVGATAGSASSAPTSGGGLSGLGRPAGTGSYSVGAAGAGAGSADATTGSAGPSGYAPGSSLQTDGATSSVSSAFGLPTVLAPSELRLDARLRRVVYLAGIGFVRGTDEELERFQGPFTPVPGTPLTIVLACRNAIAWAARPYGLLRVDAVSAGPASPHRRGGLSAPLEVRVLYARQGGVEVRQARVRCQLDARGRVIAAT